MIKTQFNQPRPRLKRLWQQIIRRKIVNQGKCLSLAGLNDNISVLVDKVKSGDSGNIESVAAVRYFKMLFGGEFVRREDDFINGVLNYGYAIIRSAIARYLAVYGLEPCLGIFHHNETNAFNLADDIIEPYRPIVDLYASQYCCATENGELTMPIKRDLLQLMASDVLLDGAKQPVSYAVERTVQSLIRCFQGKRDSLLLPELLPLHTHSYE